MYIEPNTTIKLYSGIPLDDTYNHTLWFDSLGAQTGYFHSGIAKYTLTNNSYQRVEKGKMRIEKRAEDLYDCNYLAFQNANYGNKWFYAFVTGVEYINNVTSEVSFEIDSMQTYLFDVEVKDCFVAREHSVTDEVGDNILPEPVECGEYIGSDYGLIEDVSTMCVIIAIVNGTDVGNKYDGIYSGAVLKAFSITDTQGIQAELRNYIQKPEQVLAVYTCPLKCVKASGDIESGGELLGATNNAIQYDRLLDSVSQTTQDFGGYVPKNKKLYTYPYNFLRIDNAKGQDLILRYEFFDNLTPAIQIMGTLQMPVQMVARPYNYKGLPTHVSPYRPTVSKSESIVLDNYPMCSWNVDSYKRWVAQKSLPLLLSGASRAIGGALIGGGAGGALGLASAIVNTIQQQYEASIRADECKGNISDGNVNVANNIQNFFRQRMHVTADYAKVIDDFFTMFGYTTNRIKVPNRNSRPHWNYVQTKGCDVKGSAPADDIKKICSIYDKGITFWKSASEVGDYSLDNAPT